MKTAFLAFAATASANFHQARNCAQQVNLKIGEKVTWDPDCFNEQTTGLGCIESVPGCRFCEFGEYQGIPCIGGSTFPSDRFYDNQQQGFQPIGQNTPIYQRAALREALKQRVQSSQPVRAFLVTRVQTPIRMALIERANLMSEGKRAALRDTLVSRAIERSALIERAALTGKILKRAALIERAALLGSTLIAGNTALLSQAYEKYVMAFEKIATHVAKPVSFEEFKIQPSLVRDVLHTQVARMGLTGAMNEETLANMYAEYVRKFENVPNIKPKTYVEWKQNPRLLAEELSLVAPLLAATPVLRQALKEHVRAALYAHPMATRAALQAVVTNPTVRAALMDQPIVERAALRNALSNPTIRAALSNPSFRAALQEATPFRASLIQRAALTAKVNMRQALVERAALLGATTLMDVNENALSEAYSKYVQTFENIATHVAKPVDFDTFKSTPSLAAEIIGARMGLTGEMNEEQLANMYAEYVRQFENVPNIKPKTYVEWKINPLLTTPLFTDVRAALMGQTAVHQPISQMSEQQQQQEYEAYVKGFEHIDTSVAKPMTFPVWQQQNIGHRRLGGGGYGGYGGYGIGGYGRGGYGWGGYGRGGYGGFGYGRRYGRGGYGRWGRGRFWG